LPEVLEVLADDKGIGEDMPAWCTATENELIGMEEEGGRYRIYVRKCQH
jgi:TusA-related sulfurtransferase